MSTTIETTLLFMLLVLTTVKTVHFLTAIKRRRIIDWFYFSHYRIVLSSTTESARAKRKQNAFAVSIGLLMLILGFAFYLQIMAVI